MMFNKMRRIKQELNEHEIDKILKRNTSDEENPRYNVGGFKVVPNERSLNRFVGSLYHVGGYIARGWTPDIPGSSSSPDGSIRNPASSLTDNLSGKCHGTWTVFSFAGLSNSS